MNKITMIASVLLLTAGQAFAQKEFKLAKSSGKLVINSVSNLSVEGYDGKDIIFSATTNKEEKTDDPRAAGLSALSSVGFDNTGVGLSLSEKENVTLVSAIEKDLKLTVKLPKNVALSFKTTGFANGDSTIISLSNIQSEVDASTQYEHVSLKNVTGPISIKTLYGNIEGKLTSSFKGPISLVSVYGFIDVTVPEAAKADVSINAMYETLYAAKDLNLVVDEAPVKENITFGNAVLSTKLDGQNAYVITSDSKAPTIVKGTSIATTNGTTTDKDKPAKETKTRTSSTISDLSYSYATVGNGAFSFNSGRGSTVNGKLNGGGEKIVLKSTYGKIYLRK